MPVQSQRDFALYRDLLVPDQIQARPWTVITVFFSHELHLHLLGNLLLLFVFGLRMEKHTGPLHTLILYFVTGIAGSLAILGVAEIGAYDGGIAGASAAGFGLLAAIATLSPDSSVGGKLGGKMSLKSLAILMFVINVVMIAAELSGIIGFGIIGGAGHVGGMVIGALYAVHFRRTIPIIRD